MARLAARQSESYLKKHGRKASKQTAHRPQEDLNPSDSDSGNGDDPPDEGDENSRIAARLEDIWKAAKSDNPADCLILYHDAFQEFLAPDGIASSIEQRMDSRLRSLLEAKASASIQEHKDRMVRAHVKALAGHPWHLSLLQVWGLYALDNAWPGSGLLGWLRDLSSAEQDAVEAHRLLKTAQASRALDRQARQLREHRMTPRSKWHAWMSTDVRHAIEAWIDKDEGRRWGDLTNYRKDKAFMKQRKSRDGSNASEKAGGNAGEEEQQEEQHVSGQEDGDGGTTQQEHGDRGTSHEEEEQHVSEQEDGDGGTTQQKDGDRGTTHEEEEQQEEQHVGGQEDGDGGTSHEEDDDHLPSPERGRRRDAGEEEPPAEDSFFDDGGFSGFGNDDTTELGKANASIPTPRLSIRRSISELRRSTFHSFAYFRRRASSVGTCTRDRLSFTARNRGSGSVGVDVQLPKTPTTKTSPPRTKTPTPRVQPRCQRPAAPTRDATDTPTEISDIFARCPTMSSAPPAKRPRLESSMSLQPWLDTFAERHSDPAPIELLNHADVDSVLVDDPASGLVLIVLRLNDTPLRTRYALVELTPEESIAHVNDSDMVANTSNNVHLGNIVRSLRALVPALAPHQEQAEGDHTQEPEVAFVALPFLEAQADDIVRIAILVSYKLTGSLDKMPTEIHDFAIWQYATALFAAQSPPTTAAARPPPSPTRPFLDRDTSIRAQEPFNLEASISRIAVREFVHTWKSKADQLERASIEAGRIWEILHGFQNGQHKSSGDKHALDVKITATERLIRQTEQILANSDLDSELRDMESRHLQSLEASLQKDLKTRSMSGRWKRRQAVINQLANDRWYYQLENQKINSGLEELREQWKNFAASL
ncbi:hypothetical protein AC578_2840 [Pseudocercospora eumusae]|uniref:Uncharacterized protein n=1 Tax=Pseudocercospora eumusae TaxID=321146 RepID=A0A139H4E9_9PEZI|nr:hypothetical protein AC578_2840 [Pseudocercospora eumusae]